MLQDLESLKSKPHLQEQYNNPPAGIEKPLDKNESQMKIDELKVEMKTL